MAGNANPNIDTRLLRLHKSWSSDRSGWYTIKFFYKLENWRRRECCWKQESQIKIRLFGSWDYWKEIPFTIEAIITTFWAFMTAFLLFLVGHNKIHSGRSTSSDAPSLLFKSIFFNVETFSLWQLWHQWFIDKQN